MKKQLLLLLGLLCSTCSQVPGGSDDEKELLKEGEKQFRGMVQKSQSSSCWLEAIAKLNASCKRLAITEQRRLALDFTNCFLWHSGRTTYPCDSSRNITSCTISMSDTDFNIYTKFVLHTMHICYYLSVERWHQRTTDAIQHLSNSSIEALNNLRISLQFQKAMEQKQQNLLTGLNTMEDLVHQQSTTLSTVYTSLKGVLDGTRYLLSNFLIGLVGAEALLLATLFWVFILFLPQFDNSKCLLLTLLVLEQIAEILLRKIHGVIIQSIVHPTPEDLVRPKKFNI